MNDEDAKKFYAAADAYPDIRHKTAAMILLLTGMRHTNITMQIAAGVPLVTVPVEQATRGQAPLPISKPLSEKLR